MKQQIAVLVPCYNEEAAIATVVRDFQQALPGARIYVYDNNSQDATVAIARAAGAMVRRVQRQGKGHVVRQMFADIEADAYVLVDGDATYDAATAPGMIEQLFAEQLDMVVGCRQTDEQEAYRFGHRFGNFILTEFVARLFGRQFTDILSGYRVFSKRYVKSFPAHAGGFETETELTVHALELRMPIAEVDTVYKSRPVGSVSKLNTYRDGFRILGTIIKLFRQELPIAFFSLAGGLLFVLAIALIAPVLQTYLATGLVPRLPTTVLATGLVVSALLSFACGLILDTVTQGRREIKRLLYLRTALCEPI
jgi:glycosyltransferase involved in cell wall biosynthesis